MSYFEMKGFSEEEIQHARKQAAKLNHTIAEECLNGSYGFADHVTEQEKMDYANEQKQYAKEIEQGLHDNNFTIWQRMNYYLTGKSVPFLPNRNLEAK